MKKKLIYICSPCRGNDGNYEHNIEMAQYYCRTVMHMFPNLLPIAPHVYFTHAAAGAAISAVASAAAPLLRAPDLHPDISVNAVPFPDVADIEEQLRRNLMKQLVKRTEV